jgi:signal transduction histidine kinase
MKIQTKLFFLAFLIFAMFTASLIIYISIEGNRAVSFFSDEVQDKELMFDKNLEIEGKALEALVYDYAYRDDMANFIATENKAWGEQTINTRLLSKSNINAVRIYKSDFSLLYSTNNLGYSESEQSPLPREAFNTLFMRKQFCHFFIDTPKGLMEIRGATVHPATDAERKAPPQGYFFAGRLWDKDYFRQLSELTKSVISIVPITERLHSVNIEPEQGRITFSKILNGWDNRPLRRLKIWSEEPNIKHFMRISREIFFMLCIFSTLILLLFLIFVTRWITTPLRLISNTLKMQDLTYIDSMRKDKNEYDEISMLIHKFFKQKTDLVQEIAERKKTEEELRVAYTKLKDTKEQLIQAEKMHAIGILASGVAHEVKNPLGIIMQGVNYLEKKLSPEQEDIFKSVGMIKESVERADNIIRLLLDFSRVTNLNLQPQDINSILENSLILVKQNIESKQIEVVKETKQDIPRVLVDRNKMEQVFINILLNAIQAIPKKGKMIIRSYDTQLGELKNGVHGIGDSRFKSGEKVVVVEIEDTGIGIPEENIGKIFDAFFTTKRLGEGLGLGLSICRNIIDMHKGIIEVESQVGKGSKVTITLGIAAER